jgi:tetratricopeptide (TPR) repeat protein
LPGADQARLLDRLAADNANLLEALGWAIEAGATEMALHLVADLWRYWLMSGRLQDGRQLVERVLALSGADRPTAARVRALDAAGGVAYWNADTGRAERLYREQLSIAKQLDLRWEIANATLNLAYVSFAKGDEAASARDVADAAGLFRELGDEWMLARLDWALATTLQRSGRVTEARERFLELVERYRANEDVWYEGLALGSLAWVCLALGDVREAFTWSVRSLRIAHRLRDVADMTLSLQEAALGAIAHGRPTDAAILVGAFEALCELHGIRPPAGLQITVGNVGDPAHRARAALGSEAYEEARARGASMSVEDAVAVVYDLAASLGLDA